MTVGVVHSLKVVEIDEKHRADSVASGRSGERLCESIHEQRSIRKRSQGIVQRLMWELSREGALLGDVTLGEDEVQKLTCAVASSRTRYLNKDDLPVFAEVPLD